MDRRPRKSKSVLEPSVRKDAPPRAGLQPEPGSQLKAPGCVRHGHAAPQSRMGERSALPGAEPITYSTTGQGSEHGNPEPSADVVGVSKPPGLARSRSGGGASVVVGARESRAQGEGRQSMGESRLAPGKAAYAASQSDQDWLRSVQRELHRRSREDLDYVFRKLWGFIVDPRTLRCAFQRVARNRGSRTAGIDGVTVGKLVRKSGGEDFVQTLREELKSRNFRPSPVRRVLIPKAGAPGKHRALGIPTVKDRVVQAALKLSLIHISEPTRPY